MSSGIREYGALGVRLVVLFEGFELVARVLDPSLIWSDMGWQIKVYTGTLCLLFVISWWLAPHISNIVVAENSSDQKRLRDVQVATVLVALLGLTIFTSYVIPAVFRMIFLWSMPPVPEAVLAGTLASIRIEFARLVVFAAFAFLLLWNRSKIGQWITRNDRSPHEPQDECCAAEDFSVTRRL